MSKEKCYQLYKEGNKIKAIDLNEQYKKIEDIFNRNNINVDGEEVWKWIERNIDDITYVCNEDGEFDVSFNDTMRLKENILKVICEVHISVGFSNGLLEKTKGSVNKIRCEKMNGELIFDEKTN